MQDRARKVISNGSKSFWLASLAFDRKARQGAWALYSWCRFCDDAIDLEPSHQMAVQRLSDLMQKTKWAYGDKSTTVEFTDQDRWIFALFRDLVNRHQIPQEYPLDLLRGMQMDLDHFEYKSSADLVDYCYCVAGTVGLMMSHIMGVSDECALEHAVHLGIGMQLTNIARDLQEDHERGRHYIPTEWIQSKNRSLLFSDTKLLFSVAIKLIELSRPYYDSGIEGLQYLPWRASLAVGFAQRIYFEIGVTRLRWGHQRVRERAYVSFFRKLRCCVLGLNFWQWPARFKSPWQPTRLPVWRYK